MEHLSAILRWHPPFGRIAETGERSSNTVLICRKRKATKPGAAHSQGAGKEETSRTMDFFAEWKTIDGVLWSKCLKDSGEPCWRTVHEILRDFGAYQDWIMRQGFEQVYVWQDCRTWKEVTKKCSELVLKEKVIFGDKNGQKGRPCYKCLVCSWNSKGTKTWADAEGALLSHMETCEQNEAVCKDCYDYAKATGFEVPSMCDHTDPTLQVHPSPIMRKQLDLSWKVSSGTADPQRRVNEGFGPPGLAIWWPEPMGGAPYPKRAKRSEHRGGGNDTNRKRWVTLDKSAENSTAQTKCCAGTEYEEQKESSGPLPEQQ